MPKANRQPPFKNVRLMKMKGLILILVFFLRGVCSADTLFVAAIGDNTIRRIDSSGTQSLFASDPYACGGVAFDTAGNLYWGHFGQGYIQRFTPSGGSSVFANLTMPTSVASYGGNVYVAAYYASTITKFNAAGTGSLFASTNSGLNRPSSLAFDAAGNLYVANQSAGNVLKITPSGASTIVAIAGDPAGVAVDAQGDLFVSDDALDQIKKITPDGTVITFASGLNNPYGLAFDSSGYLYEADSGSGNIYKFDHTGGRTLFASGLSLPRDLAFQPIPEPSVPGLLMLALAAFAYNRRNSVP
jgi:sugar lactone lactonase YvrE